MRALLLDDRGRVVEASTANVILYRREEGLVSPPAEQILPGVSIAVVAELARELDLPMRHREIFPEDVASADEVMLSSTSPCLLPVVSFNRRSVGSGRPGEVFRRLLTAWSEHVGRDIREQAVRFRQRSGS